MGDENVPVVKKSFLNVCRKSSQCYLGGGEDP